MTRRVLPFALATLLAGISVLPGARVELLVAQTPVAGTPPESLSAGAVRTAAVSAITATELARYAAVFAADSMRDRVTPSPALERAAAYVASRFQKLGLSAVDNRSLIQRYPVPGQYRLDRRASWLSVTANVMASGGRGVVTEVNEPVTKSLWRHFTASDFAFVRELGTPVVVESSSDLFDLLSTLPAVLVAGLPSSSALGDAVRNKVVLYIPPASIDSVTKSRVLAQLAKESTGVIVVSDQDSAHFASVAANDPQQPVQVVEWFMHNAIEREGAWAVMLQASALTDLLPTIGIDLARLLADSTPVVRPLKGVEIMFRVEVDSSSVRETAPNVAGVLEGVDPVLKKSYLVIAARMDADSALSRQPDSVVSDLGGHMSEVASLLALAEAYSQPDARPRRSLVFLATSGGGPGRSAWGGNAYVDRNPYMLSQQVAVINVGRLDGTGAASDSLFVDGLHDVELATNPEWTAAEHPELGLVIADGGALVDPSAEYSPFAHAGFPTLGFRARASAGMAGKGAGGAAQVERAARFLRFVFYVGKNLADTDRPPHWTSVGRQHQYKRP